MGKIRGDTGSIYDIVQGELVDNRASLQEQRQRLDIATCLSAYRIMQVNDWQQLHTWPMPPEAPRTTAHHISDQGIASGFGPRALPALTIVVAYLQLEFRPAQLHSDKSDWNREDVRLLNCKAFKEQLRGM